MTGSPISGASRKMSAPAVFAALAPVFLLIMTGVALKRWLVTRDEHWAGAEQVVYYVLFPALLIVTLAFAAIVMRFGRRERLEY